MSFILVRPTPGGGGLTLANLDGTVRSLNPAAQPPTTYTWSARPAGTAGPFELCTVDGGVVAFNPMGTEAVLFPYKSSVPNAPGLAALGTEPLTNG